MSPRRAPRICAGTQRSDAAGSPGNAGDIQRAIDRQPMRFPVQYVNRPNLGIFGGMLAPGVW